MGKKRKKIKKESNFSLNIKNQRLIIAVILFVLAIILFLGLINLAGKAGQILTLGLQIIFGWGSWFVPISLLGIVFLVLNYPKVEKLNKHKEKKPSFNARWISLILLVFIVSSLLHLPLFQDKGALSAHQGGGYFGYAISYVLVNTFGIIASWVILLGVLIVDLIVIFSGAKKGKQEGKDEEKSEQQRLFFTNIFGKLKPIFKRKKQLKLKPESAGELTDEQKAEDEIEQEETKEEQKKGIFRKKIIEQKQGEMPVSYHRTGKKIDLPLELLASDSSKPNAGDIKQTRYIIKKTLENFNIPVEMGEVKVGPTVSQYTLKPVQGVKLSKITSLHNDLALALAAHPIRIEAPIPGQSLVGIEVPNQKIAIIRLRSILSDAVFKNRKSDLVIALGRDVAGNILLANIPKMPHMLVAGSTGSGKTIFLNSIIISLIYQNSPDDLRFILVDPKRVELTLYNDLPHLLTPVITNTQKTVNALKWAVNEMERRFDVMAEAKKRDIHSYNESHPDDKLPFIIIIIDELADLMVTASQEVEACIVRLAQMARATGIHLIVATQRPSVDVITGLIKANITTRVAFSVASLMDSRTILDFSGAEKLLGNGDMLFVSSELSKPKRIQGAFVSDQEVKGIVEYLRNVSEPNFQEDITNNQEVEGLSGSSSESDLKKDELLPEARDIIIQEEGTIGPADGAKPRDVYKSSSDVEETETEEEQF